jgi:transposase-like protein
MCTVPKPYPREIREDVVRPARNREPGMRIKDIAADFGISESRLTNWMAQADREEGVRVGPSSDEHAKTPGAASTCVCLLEQMNEVLRRAAASLSQASFPANDVLFVRELADDGIPVTVTCRVIKVSRQPYFLWLARPVTDAEFDEA